MLDPAQALGPLPLLAVAAAAVAAGIVNALAGGGTLLTFPVLIAVGLPALAANITNTVALCPGHIGATMAQREGLRGQRALLAVILPAGVAGGLVGGLLLLHTGEHTFRAVVPFLLLTSSGLLAAQDRQEFESLLHRALEIDPDAKPEWRLENLVMQRRARWLLGRASHLFVE